MDCGTEGLTFSMILKILLSDDVAEGPDWGTEGPDWGTEGLGGILSLTNIPYFAPPLDDITKRGA